MITAKELLEVNRHKKPTTETMIEFAKFHVEEALKAAAEKAYERGVFRVTILSSYNLDNIK